MTTKQRVRVAMQRWWQKAERARWQYGTLGRVNSDSTVTVAAGRKDHVYVTLDTGTLTEAYNKGNGAVPLRAGLPVRLRQEAGRLIVDGEDVSGLLEGDANAPGTVYSVNDIGPDSHGNVTLDPDDLDDAATTNKFTTAAEITKLAGIEALADVTDAGNIASSITGVSTDDTIGDADIWGYLTGGVLVKTAWSNIKAVLKTYFDTVYTFAAIVADNSITNAKLRDSGALSVIGRSANSSGDPADISATAATDAVLRESGSALGFGTVATGGIANSAVTTAKILDANVTLAKLANIATDSLIGRDTASSGVPENILLNATLSMDGSGNLQRAALTGDVAASAGSNTTAIGSNKVLTAMIADAQVTLAKMADLAQSTIIGRAAGAGTGVPTALSVAQVVAILNATLDHGTLAGLTDDDHAGYALLAGRSGGQTLKGDTASGGNFTLMSTAHATKGKILFGASAYDEANNRLGIATNAPSHLLTVGTPETPIGTGARVGIYNAGGAYGIFRDTTFDVELGYGVDSSGYVYIGSFTNHPFAVVLNNATLALYVTTSGNVGIGGMTTPQGKLHIHDGTGGKLFRTVTGVNGSETTLIPDGTGDVVKRCIFSFVGIGSGGTNLGNFTGGLNTPGAASVTQVINNLTFKLYSTGQLVVFVSSGVETYSVTVDVLWQ